MKSLNEDLKTGQFKQVYLLYGEESYLKKQYKDRLSKAMLPEGDTMNYAYYEGKGTDVKQVIDLAETLPFFAPRRLIVMEDTGFFKSASPELSEYIRSMPETACFLFVESEVDKRGKLYKAVKEKGRIVEMTRQDGATLQKWVLSMIQKEGKQITQSAVRFFLTKVGDDMENIHGELEKLFCYTMGRTEITIHDMEEICTTHIDNQIFEMIHAVAEKRQKQALLYLSLIHIYDTLPANTKILSVSTKDQICYVNFDQELMNMKSNVKPEILIYSIVNSIVESGTAGQVQISINGESDIRFGQSVPLDQPLSRNLDLVEGEGKD